MAVKGRIGLVGGGNMGSALLRGILKKKAARPDQVILAEMNRALGKKISEETGVEWVSAPEKIGGVDVLMLAVKPVDMPAVCAKVSGGTGRPGLVITIAAGLPIARLAEDLHKGQAIIRAMPNTPALVGAGVTALAPGPEANQAHLDTAVEIFSAVGQVVVVKESQMDAVTALSGSGPAYVFLLIEALADAGVAQGLDRATALTLAAQTVEGSAKLMNQTGMHPAALKDKVTSPGGTTAAGLAVLERGGMRGILIDAVAAATERGKELGAK